MAGWRGRHLTEAPQKFAGRHLNTSDHTDVRGDLGGSSLETRSPKLGREAILLKECSWRASHELLELSMS